MDDQHDSRRDGRVKTLHHDWLQFPRRAWLATVAATTAGLTARAAQPRRLVVRSSWQTVNIGDIAHTPGILRLLETHLPDVEVWLWPSNVGNGVRELLARRFPRIRILDPRKDVAEIFAECDFLLHGSGPSLVARRDLRRWREETGKPYGVYGITLDPFFVPDSKRPAGSRNEAIDDSLDLLSTAEFVFFRDSRSLAFAREQGCFCPIMQFGPDAAFATDLRDDAAAERFLKQHDLEPGQFL
ncbi:MAG: polysaccharide pyruvyl transferase family protein, partial [Planctomycetia bacterium]|nr:polysaccharide pyruvyl transferase family protein [Planctomycetia bacterium]